MERRAPAGALTDVRQFCAPPWRYEFDNDDHPITSSKRENPQYRFLTPL
ncbi:hypothetical protein KCP70_01085 [Salmonella enterica subsp. enterica]|nr:hypothetical protein KCP70_01085 [Salmonella enterica subsp. enterica]